jgi:hypothetical protein
LHIGDIYCTLIEVFGGEGGGDDVKTLSTSTLRDCVSFLCGVIFSKEFSMILDERNILYTPVATSEGHTIIMDKKGLLVYGDNDNKQIPYFNGNLSHRFNRSNPPVLCNQINIEHVLGVYCSHNVTFIVMSDNSLHVFGGGSDGDFEKIEGIEGLIINVIPSYCYFYVHTTCGIFVFGLDNSRHWTRRHKIKSFDEGWNILHISCDMNEMFILTTNGLFGICVNKYGQTTTIQENDDDDDESSTSLALSIETHDTLTKIELPFHHREIKRLYCQDGFTFIIRNDGRVYISKNLALSMSLKIPNEVDHPWYFIHLKLSHNYDDIIDVIDVYVECLNHGNIEKIIFFTKQGLFRVVIEKGLKLELLFQSAAALDKPGFKHFYKGLNAMIIQTPQNSLILESSVHCCEFEYYVYEWMEKCLKYTPIVIFFTMFVAILYTYFTEHPFLYVFVGLTGILLITLVRSSGSPHNTGVISQLVKH